MARFGGNDEWGATIMKSKLQVFWPTGKGRCPLHADQCLKIQELLGAA